MQVTVRPTIAKFLFKIWISCTCINFLHILL